MTVLNELLLDRSAGKLGPNTFARYQSVRFLKSLRSALRFGFDGGEGQGQQSSHKQPYWAHQAGVSALAVERFDGRLLLSGGSDGSIRLWDLEQSPNPSLSHRFRPIAEARRAGSGSNDAGGHHFGVNDLCFYPFDSGAFLSSSYDQTLKLWSTETARLSGSFNLGARVYTHSVSPIASHLLVACATQHPAIRLVDLRSNNAVQSLISPSQLGASTGANLAVAWSPSHEHILASGSSDGAVRLWDVRRANALIGQLDLEDSLGIFRHRDQFLHVAGSTSVDPGARRERVMRVSAKAHSGAVNGLGWTDDGSKIVSTGHDAKIRVWDAATGANTLVSFGSHVRNSQLSTVKLVISPTGLTGPHRELLFFPNETEILLMDLHQGTTITRLRGVGPTVATVHMKRGNERAVRNKLTSIAWRGAGGGGSSSGVVSGGSNAGAGAYSGHLDGQIRVWMPQLQGLDAEDEDETVEEATEDHSRKRKALDDVYKSMMGKQVRFS